MSDHVDRIAHVVAVALLAGWGRRAGPVATACVRIGDGKTELKGVLAVEMHYGPPNYGEDTATDARYHIWVLRTDMPFKSCPDSPDIPEVPAGTDSLTRVTG